MKLIEPKVELIQQAPGLIGMYKHIERCARTCYSEKTEILTDSGWKYFPDVTNNDLVLTYNPDNNTMSYDNPNIVTKEFEGHMIKINHPNIQLCVTPDHRIYQSAPHKRDYSFLRAAQLIGDEKINNSKQCKFRIPKYFNNAKRDLSCIFIPEIHYTKIVKGGFLGKVKKEINFTVSEDFMVIAGAFISEGHTVHKEKWGAGSCCQITQDENSLLYTKTLTALDNLQWKYRINNDPRKPNIKWIMFGHGTIWADLFDELFGKGSRNKHLPEWFRTLPDDYLKVLIETMYLGDGSHSTNRKERYLSKSLRLLNELQEAFILLGKNAAYTYDKYISQKCSLEESTRDSWIISKKHIHKLSEKKRTVYCTSTNTGIVCVRYNNKVCWCGNCYKSEDKITEDSYKKMYDNFVQRKHLAMLEHGTVYLCLEINPDNYAKLFDYPSGNFTGHYNWTDVAGRIYAKYNSNPYSKVNNTFTKDNKFIRKVYITTNLRVIIENHWEDDLNFICEPTEFHERRITLKFTTNIGVTREGNRHRVNSIAEESTRYCNYTKEQFGSELNITRPVWINKENIPEWDESQWLDCIKDLLIDGINPDYLEQDPIYWYCMAIEFAGVAYRNLIRLGWSPQQAREVLPLATKSEVVYTAFASDWRHWFDLRLVGTTGKPHPNMEQVAWLAQQELIENNLWELIYPDNKHE